MYSRESTTQLLFPKGKWLLLIKYSNYYCLLNTKQPQSEKSIRFAVLIDIQKSLYFVSIYINHKLVFGQFHSISYVQIKALKVIGIL